MTDINAGQSVSGPDGDTTSRVSHVSDSMPPREVTRLTPPTAEVIRASHNPSFSGAYLATILCPKCAGSHTHGAPDLDALRNGMGHRVGHCPRRGDGYVIAPYSGPIGGRPRRG